MLTSTKTISDISVNESRIAFNDGSQWRTIVLHRPMRSIHDLPFARLLDNMRVGKCDAQDLDIVNNIRVDSITDPRVLRHIDKNAKIIVNNNNLRDSFNMTLSARWAKLHGAPMTYFKAADKRVSKKSKADDHARLAATLIDSNDVDVATRTTLTRQDSAAVAKYDMMKTGKMLRLVPLPIGMAVVLTDNAAAGPGGVQIG